MIKIVVRVKNKRRKSPAARALSKELITKNKITKTMIEKNVGVFLSSSIIAKKSFKILFIFIIDLLCKGFRGEPQYILEGKFDRIKFYFKIGAVQ